MKLLPCPFCGGEPEEYGGMFFEFYGHERQDYSIACKKCRAEVRCDVGEHEGADAPCSCHHDTRKICAEKWNRRAAMLQGAEPVTTANKLPFEQWLSQQTGTIDVECGCVMTEVFFHWLRVAYEAGNSPVIPDGWVACSELMPEEGSKVIVFRPRAEESNDPPVKTAIYKGGREYYHGFDCYCEPTHWMPLPAAPQQEA